MTVFVFRDQIKLQYVSDAFTTVDSGVSNGYHKESEAQNFDDEDLEGACSLPLPKAANNEAPIDIEELTQIETSKILELFPNYGTGYIRRLLAFYDNSSEKVISVMLEGKKRGCSFTD